MNVVLVGGTGYVGSAVQAALLSRGHQVKVIARHGRVLDGARLVPGDVRDMDLVTPFIDADAVINLVGIIKEVPAENITFDVMHVETVRRIITAMSATHVHRLIHMSALGTRPGAKARYHRTKWIAEDLITHTTGLHYTITRPSLLFGGGAPFFKMLQSQVKLPVTPIPGPGTSLFQPIFRGDVANFLALCVDTPETIGQTYEMGGPETLTLNALYDRVAKAIGKPHITPWHIPYGLMMRLAKVGQNLPGFPVSVDQLMMLAENNATEDRRWEKFSLSITSMQKDF